MIKKIITIIIIALLFSLACNDKPNVPATGLVNLYIQDGMADYDSIYMLIDSVWTYTELDSTIRTLHKNGLDTIIISDLRNGRDELLFSENLRSGYIDGISIEFRQGLVFIDGGSYGLLLPESGTSVYSLPFPFLLSVGDTIDMLVDINLYESIIVNPENDDFGFDPSLRIIDIDSSAAIIGRTSPQAHIFLFERSTYDTLAFTISEGNSLEFGFYGLEPGVYDMLCKPIGDDTLQYDQLVNTYISAVIGETYDLGLLTLPQP